MVCQSFGYSLLNHLFPTWHRHKVYRAVELELFSGLSWGFKLSTDTCKGLGEWLLYHTYSKAEATVSTFCKKKPNYNCSATSAWIPDKRGAWVAATRRFRTFPSPLVFTPTGLQSGLDYGAVEWFEFTWSCCYAALSILFVCLFWDSLSASSRHSAWCLLRFPCVGEMGTGQKWEQGKMVPCRISVLLFPTAMAL